MMNLRYVAVGAAALVVLAGPAATMPVATQSTSSVTVNATPTDPNDAESTHTVVFTPSVTTAGSSFNDIRINYSVDSPAADVSNVGAGTVERIGIDRDGDDVGTRIDDTARITEVSGKSDGTDLLVRTNGELDINAGDEIVVVIRPVQNPQTSGDVERPQVGVTLNTQSAADSATDTVTYEYNSATVEFTDQSTGGDTVTVDEVTLSEDGYVVISNRSGRNPSEVRGATFLPAGTHSDVGVDVAPPVDARTELYAQVHMDTNGDHRFGYGSSGGEVDGPFENRDGNVMASDPATVWHDSRTQTQTPAGGSGDGAEDPPAISNFDASANGGEVTVSFDSNQTLSDVEVDVRGAEDATLTTEDFDGNQYEPYTATYQADSDGEYTFELVTADGSDGEDGADGGDFTDSVTVGDSNAAPTDEPGEQSASPIGDDADGDPAKGDGGSGTEAPTADTQAGDGTEGGDESDTGSPTDDDGAGFGGLIALVALLASALLFCRRR